MKFKNKTEALKYYRKKNIKGSIETGTRKFTSLLKPGEKLTYLLMPQKEIVKYYLLGNDTFEQLRLICGRTLHFGKILNTRCLNPPGAGTDTPKIGFCNHHRRAIEEKSSMRHYVSEIISPDRSSTFISIFQAHEREPQSDTELLNADINLLASMQEAMILGMLRLGYEPIAWGNDFREFIVDLVLKKQALIKTKFTIEKINMLTQEDVERWLLSVRSKLNRQLGEGEGDKIFFTIAETHGIFDKSQFLGSPDDPLKAKSEEQERFLEEKYRKMAESTPIGYGKEVEEADFEDIIGNDK